MLSVEIKKDFTEYRPKVISGFSGRAAASVGSAIGFALAFGAVCTFVLHIDVDVVMPLIWFAAVPPSLIGFYSPHGMTFEKFLPLYIEHAARNQQLVFKTPSYNKDAEDDTENSHDHKTHHAARWYRRLKSIQGIETWDIGELS